MNDKLYDVWLSTVAGVGSVTIKNLYEVYETSKDIYDLTPSQIDEIDFLSKNQKIALKAKNLDYAQSIIEDCLEKDIEIISFHEENYPEMLKNIYDPPIVLYKKGIPFDFNNTAMVGIVGTRRASVYGDKCATMYAYDLSKANIVVVSGMAMGIDTSAHRGALKAGSVTVAVLGTGVDVCYPLENKEIYEYLCKYGVIISEYPPKTTAHPGHFPKRNRIISGISKALLVVEAGLRSGALITADLANEQGKSVYAIPNVIMNKASTGTNNIIKEYAYLTNTPNDIIEYFYGRYNVGKTQESEKADEEFLKMLENLSDEEKLVAKCLSDKPKYIDTLVRETNFPAGKIGAIMTMLEIYGIAVSHPGNSYSLKF